MDSQRLRRLDYLWLVLLCGILYGFSLINPRILSTHETTHCLNVAEMKWSGDWVIPTYGGRPWLERPPVPHWITAAGVWLAGDSAPERAYRIGSILYATIAVLIFAWAIAGCLGRTIGVMSGAILATMREYATYATGPEADIFLGATVTIAGALLIRSLFDPIHGERRHGFVGGRSWSTILFFILLGAMNAMKGPLFGMFFIVLPLGAYWLWGRSIKSLRPVIWLWGWLLCLAIGIAWPAIALWRFPDVMEMWAVDYGVRWQKGYLGEPFWYYFVQQPWNEFPWSLPIIVGLFCTARSAWSNESPIMRFIWCWAIVPVLFFSLFKGKHHHYMLSCLAPAAVLGAYGAIYWWRKMQNWPNWLRQPWLAIPLFGMPGAVLVYLLRRKIPGPDWMPAFCVAVWVCAAFASWYAMGRRQARIAFVGFCAIAVVVQVVAYEAGTRCYLEYTWDREFIEQVRATAPPDQALLVLGEMHPLNSSWNLFYLGQHARLLHNESFLCDERLDVPSVYVVARPTDVPRLLPYGTPVPVIQSARTRGEHSSDDRYTLYLLTFHPNLERFSANVHITPMQATGRDLGPFLGKPPAWYVVQSH